MASTIHNILAASADPRLAADDLARFNEAFTSMAGAPFPWDQPGAASLARIFGMSRALTARLHANPGWAPSVAHALATGRRSLPEALRESLAAEVARDAGSDETAFLRALRHFKYRELIRIVCCDLEGGTPVAELLEEWSDVADLLIDAAYSRAHAILAARHGMPMLGASESTIPCTGTIIALGKLGGRELNVSSDVDLLILYAADEGGARSAGGETLTNHEFYVKLATLLTRMLAAATDDGFVFRVDHELRPEGQQGPLANALDAAERYYEYFGRDWERQALIRARAVAGDLTLGRSFVEAMRPFVYRRSIAIADIAHMREMKGAMARSAERRNTSYDVKHGEGGIREIEFLTQAFSLLYGGQRPAVRAGNTFAAIEALARESLLHPYAAKALSGAYAFLRRAENMLQAADELQTHALPGDGAGLAALARRLGYREGDEASATAGFRSDLARHTAGSAKLFHALFEADYERLELMEAIRDNADRAANEEEALDSLGWFKREEQRRIQNLDLSGLPLPEVQRRLTLAAEAVIACAWEMAERQLLARYGAPQDDAEAPAAFAIVGQGSLGSSEIDYGSDLDLCFLFSAGGRTQGPASVTNVEYFTKLAQRIISMISLHGRYGRAYLIDSELRPSGRSGALVATLASFAEYHGATAQIWERLALLKARAITGDAAFVQEVDERLRAMAYQAPPPDASAVRAEILRLRERRLAERLRPAGGVIDLKIGRGGLADLEAILQLTQLAHAPSVPGLWKQNAFDVLAALSEARLITPDLHEAIGDHLLFLRRLLSRVRLASGRATDEIDLRAPFIEALATQMACTSPEALASEVRRRMEAVEALFHRAIEEGT